MFQAEHISLSSGQSYQNVEILEPEDYEIYNVPNISGPMTIAFMVDNQVISLNQWNMRVIKLSSKWYKNESYLKFDRLVMEKDIIYQDGRIIQEQYWNDIGIKKIIGPDLLQVVWTNEQGTMLSHDANIVGLITKDTRTGNTDRIVPRYALHLPKIQISTPLSAKIINPKGDQQDLS